MEGDRVGPGRGIIPRAIDEVFAFIENDAAPRSKYLVRAAFLQIYNEARAFISLGCLLAASYLGDRMQLRHLHPHPATHSLAVKEERRLGW